MEQTIEVAAAVIEQAGRVLICQRPAGKSCGLLWEFPGGKREQGETLQACAARECREELGVGLAVRGLLAEATHVYPDRTVHLSFFRAEILDGTVRRLEHNDVRWVPAAELTRYPFCPADEEVVRRLAGRETADG